MLKEMIIKKFVFTSKSEKQRKENNVYTFFVSSSSNKFKIRDIIEKLFDVKVESVRISVKKPILINSRKNLYTKLRKKAFVELKPGYEIGKFNNDNSSHFPLDNDLLINTGK